MDLKRYNTEIRNIISELNSLENGEFLEANGEPGIESAKIIAKNIRISFLELLVKISNDKEKPGDPFSDFF